jgi:hypothetical protein
MPTRPNFTAQIYNLSGLRRLVAGLGYIQTRGRGAGKVGSVQQFLNELAAGHAAALVVDEWPVLVAAAEALETFAAGQADWLIENTIRGCAAALRDAAARQKELEEAELDTE